MTQVALMGISTFLAYQMVSRKIYLPFFKICRIKCSDGIFTFNTCEN